MSKLILGIGWISLEGEAKHNEPTEEALHNLKGIVEEQSHSSMRTV
jgi:hypothetical protein